MVKNEINNEQLLSMPVSLMVQALNVYYKSDNSVKSNVLTRLKYELLCLSKDKEMLKSSLIRGGLVAGSALGVAFFAEKGASDLMGFQTVASDYVQYLFPAAALGTASSIWSYHRNTGINTNVFESALLTKINLERQIAMAYGLKKNTDLIAWDCIAVGNVYDSNGNRYDVIAAPLDVYSTSDNEPPIFTGVILPDIKDGRCVGYSFKKADVSRFGFDVSYDSRTGSAVLTNRFNKKIDRHVRERKPNLNNSHK